MNRKDQPHLPIEAVLPQVQELLAQNANLVVQAPPGAGKSTLLPLSLLHSPWLKGQKIIMLEPRRLATKSVAQRMAFLLGENIGETVGYAIRFERKSSTKTRLEVVTEGILTRRLQQDNALEGVGAVIFDEFHERSLQAELGLALCREVQQILRPELRLLIMSATFDASGLARILKAPVVESQGRQFPIKQHYWPPEPQKRLPQQMANTLVKALVEFDQGDILAFLPGVGEIRQTATLLEERGIHAKICPLFGQLPFSQQQEAILPDPEGRRKVVLATSIAETSLTIEGVKVVVDSGLTRRPRFDRQTGFTKLETVQITRDVAKQRSGRAGRLSEGHCVRMWSKLTQEHLDERFPPEIAEADLAPLLLSLKDWGTEEVGELSWLTPPPERGIEQATELLQSLEAIDGLGRITERGRALAQFPAHPRIAHLLLEGRAQGQGETAANLAALLEERDPLDAKQVGAGIGIRLAQLAKSDAKDRRWGKLLKSAQAWKQQLKVSSTRGREAGPEVVGQLLSYAYPERVAKQLEPHGIRYQLASGTIVRLAEGDALTQEPWLVIAHLDAGNRPGQKHADGRAFLAAPVNVALLSHRIKPARHIAWNLETGALEAKTISMLGVLEVESQPLKEVKEEERLEALAKALRQRPQWLDWSKEAINWQARVESLRQWRPEEGWPKATQEALIQRLEDWLLPFAQQVTHIDHLKKLNLLDMLPTILSYEQQQAAGFTQIGSRAPAGT